MGRLTNTIGIDFQDKLGRTLLKGDQVVIASNSKVVIKRVARITGAGVWVCDTNAPSKCFGELHKHSEMVKMT